jgi:agmatine deiminase
VLKGQEGGDRRLGFNAWGGKYPPYDDDDAVPDADRGGLKLPVFYPRSSWKAARRLQRRRDGADDNRLPAQQEPQPEALEDADREVSEGLLRPTHVCWLTGGIEGDDTDGHIDDLARFISPTKVVIGDRGRPEGRELPGAAVRPQAARRLRDQDGGLSRSSRSRCRAVVHDGQRLPRRT